MHRRRFSVADQMEMLAARVDYQFAGRAVNRQPPGKIGKEEHAQRYQRHKRGKHDCGYHFDLLELLARTRDLELVIDVLGTGDPPRFYSDRQPLFLIGNLAIQGHFAVHRYDPDLVSQQRKRRIDSY